MKTLEYLEAFRLAVGIESDYATAKHLEVTRQAVSKWRTGREVPGPMQCFKIAEALAGYKRKTPPFVGVN